jgi:hypothetical protein
VLGAPASIIGSEFPQFTFLRPFALPSEAQSVTGSVAEVVSQHQGMQRNKELLASGYDAKLQR